MSNDLAVSRGGVDILEGLWYHRLLSSEQLNELYTPGKTSSWTRSILSELAGWGLVKAVRARARGAPKYWYLTQAGGEAVATISDNVTGSAPTIEQAASVLQAHTVALNDVGLAFVRTAREHDDDCVPLAWEHEVQHRMGPGAGQAFRCDGLLRYGILKPRGTIQRHYFIELDRCTETMDQLVEKLRRYAAYRNWVDPDAAPGTTPGGIEAWRRRYPAFPRLLFVFAPSTKAEDTKALRRRAQRVLSMAVADPIILHALGRADDFRVGACLLEELVRRGAYSPIFHEIGARETGSDRAEFFVQKHPVNLLGQDEGQIAGDGDNPRLVR